MLCTKFKTIIFHQKLNFDKTLYFYKAGVDNELK